MFSFNIYYDFLQGALMNTDGRICTMTLDGKIIMFFTKQEFILLRASNLSRKTCKKWNQK